jgi:hypothetical protein
MSLKCTKNTDTNEARAWCWVFSADGADGIDLSPDQFGEVYRQLRNLTREALVFT